MKIKEIVSKLNLSKYQWFQTFLKQKYAHSVIVGEVIFIVDWFTNLTCDNSDISQAFVVGFVACLISAFFIYNPLKK